MKKVKTVTLYTPEGERFIKYPPEMPWNVYPRPHMQRDSFLCLNGQWDFRAVVGKAVCYDGEITVPFSPSSVLSGVGKVFADGTRLCYSKKFSLPEGFLKDKAILHIGAVDQVADVKLNGVALGSHTGGYDSFSFDVTELIKQENILEVETIDYLDKKIEPYGKQRHKRGGMWYTPISGIWQTVWLESVPEKHISEIKIITDDAGADVYLDGEGELCGMVELGHERFYLKNGHARINISSPRLWSPEDPYIYDIGVRVGKDYVRSYFALRTLDIREIDGKNRLCLNGRPYFFHGLLDQGYFSDGIFLPADPSGYERDILEAKRLGFNMLRKHIKIEPEVFYSYCDRLGIVVFQDMVNNGDYSFLRDTALPTIGIKKLNDKKLHRDIATREAFLSLMDKTVKKLSFHPSVCYWTIFNEGWGQFDHAAAYNRLLALDNTRFIDSVSGWFMPKNNKDYRSDVESLHVYFKPVNITGSETGKPVVLSEFGGYSYKAEGHCFNLTNNYGYRTFSDLESFEAALERLYTEEVIPAIEKGLCAAVYTQLTDVEDETNGLLSYDRQVVKVGEKTMLNIAQKIFEEYK